MLIIGLASMVLTSCQKQEDVSEVTEPAKTYVLADLALSLPASTAPRTRMTSEVTQTNGNFRGIQRLSIIPFTKQGKITSTDMPSYYESDPIVNNANWTTVPETTVPENTNKVHHYQKVHLMKGVASFLTYGQAAAVTGKKDIDGSLIPKVEGQSQTAGIMPERMAVSPANLTFELEKIYKESDVPEGATAIANYLTHIARAEGKITDPETGGEETVSWKDAEDAWLQLLYMNFINQNDQETNIMPGSARNVKAFVSTLYRRLAAMNYNDGTIEKAIVNDIMDRIKNYTGVTCEGEGDALKVTSLGTYDSYPNDLDLPDGAAAVLWDMTAEENQRAFVPQTVTTLDAPINTINRFAYPPELYYYSNSRIKTSNTEILANDYKLYPQWTDVLANLYYPYDGVVGGDTKAVAIKEPLQYGVAHLSATIASKSSSLPDADGNHIEVEYQSKPSFPVTGIIICGQHPVDFEFKVKTTATGETTGDELFIYDRHLGGSPYLKFGDPASGPFETLALQNEDGKDVTIMLELENRSDKNFKGEDGIVYKGTKFYLTGQVKLSGGSDTGVSESEKEDVKKRVFTQDHTTTVTMKVQTLAHAYNVMPNVLSGRLEIGVDIKLDWVGTTPTTVILTGEETTNGN
jgi:hypothetical protein